MNQTKRQSQLAAPTERELGMIEASHAREELYDTLGQLRVQLDYAQRIDNSVSRARHRLIAQKRESPIAFGAAIAGVAAVCGLSVWAVASKIVQMVR